LRVQVLGPLCVWCDGESVCLGPTGQRAVLGLLALVSGQPLARAAMVDALWPGRPPPPTAANIIQTHVTHLRRLLEPDRPARAPSTVLRWVGDGYVLPTSTVTVDLMRFRQLVASAASAQQGRQLDRAAELLDEALALWHGPPLVDIPVLAGHPKLVAVASERQAALAQYGEVMIACGDAAAAVPVLEEAAAADPLDEAAQARLIRAYQAAGRRSRAFVTYHDVRRRLADELGIAPGPKLTAAHAALLHEDAGAVPHPAEGGHRDARAATAGSRSAAPVPAHLPADVPVFTGRAAELARLDSLLGICDPSRRAPRLDPCGDAGRGGSSGRATATDCRCGRTPEPSVAVVSAVSGAAGVGKTALAVRWAHRAREQFPDGQLYIDLRGYDPEQPVSPADALARFLRALGLADNDVPLDVDERAACYRSLMHGRRMLVVLDNAGSVDQIRPLLPGSASCPVLVTSRDSLAGLVARHGARRLELDLLPLDDAVELIRRLIGERADAERDAVARLAIQCARLPLALRVAAELGTSRPGIRLSHLVRELADQRRTLNLLDAGGDPRTGVRAILSWSYLNLPADAARAFRLLGLHPGPDLDAYATAALIGRSLDETHRLLDLLARTYLVQCSAERRYSMHDLLGAYAVGQAVVEDDEADRQAAVTGLLDHYLQTAAAAMDTLHPTERHRRPKIPPPANPTSPVTEPSAAHAWLEAERANLIATAAHAATHGWPEHAIGLTLILFRHLDGAGHYLDAVTMTEHGLVAARNVADRESLAQMQTNLAVICAHQGRNSQAIDHLRQALALYREIGEHAGEARALGNLAVITGVRGDRALAIDLLQQALRLLRDTGEEHGEIRALGNLGSLHTALGSPTEAADYLRQGLALSRRIGDRVGEAVILDFIGELHQLSGEHEQAAEHHEQALVIADQTSQPAVAASALNGLGSALLGRGRPAVARTHHQAALTLAMELGDRYQQARSHAGLARAGQAGAAPPDGGTVHGHWLRAHALYSVFGAPEAEAIRADLAAMDRTVTR
jgi:DNA-binding SARP family transcriptional activator